MKIVDNRVPFKKFIDLKIGDTFIFDKVPCLKIKETDTKIECVKFINAIDLTTYKPLSIGNEFIVTPIKTELHILE